MTYRIVHWGAGATGRLALGATLERPDMELVGLAVPPFGPGDTGNSV